VHQAPPLVVTQFILVPKLTIYVEEFFVAINEMGPKTPLLTLPYIEPCTE